MGLLGLYASLAVFDKVARETKKKRKKFKLN